MHASPGRPVCGKKLFQRCHTKPYVLCLSWDQDEAGVFIFIFILLRTQKARVMRYHQISGNTFARCLLCYTPAKIQIEIFECFRSNLGRKQISRSDELMIIIMIRGSLGQHETRMQQVSCIRARRPLGLVGCRNINEAPDQQSTAVFPSAHRRPLRRQAFLCLCLGTRWRLHAGTRAPPRHGPPSSADTSAAAHLLRALARSHRCQPPCTSPRSDRRAGAAEAIAFAHRLSCGEFGAAVAQARWSVPIPPGPRQPSLARNKPVR